MKLYSRIGLAVPLVLFAIVVCFPFVMGAKIPCDIDSKNVSCPFGSCCVRNQSSFTDTFCQKLGGERSSCATYASKFICPCSDKYFCDSNKDALFGKCKSKVVDIKCDLNSRNTSCPSGMCCVRDEFLFSYTYCKAYGVTGSNCVTHPSFYECPCKTGYVCTSNVQGGHVSSVFGSCKSLATSPATETSATMSVINTTTHGATASPDLTTDAPIHGHTTAPDATTQATSASGKPKNGDPSFVG